MDSRVALCLPEDDWKKACHFTLQKSYRTRCGIHRYSRQKMDPRVKPEDDKE
ncbi:hypothetical protein [Prosthecochloris sp.]|uniref:hypothetical protein n=1 Tax=Prosthecochloris sp. TaxID=290513 RepID=UPI0025D5B9F7|nr:hypothetical protein [Prosthecochloris sp.]